MMMVVMMAAAPIVRGAAAMLPPERISQIEVARIGGSADHSAGDGANDQTRTHITARGRSDQRTAPCTKEAAAGRPVSGGRSAARQHR